MNERKPLILMAMSTCLGYWWAHIVPVEVFVWLAKRRGYDGIQYSPIRFVASIQVLLGLLTPYARRHIFAAEMSYRAERSISEAWRHKARALALFRFFLLPEQAYSLKHLRALQRLVGKQLLCVAYPAWPWQEYEKFYELNNRLFQPEPGLFERFGGESVADIAKILADIQNFSGICLDTYHLRRGFRAGEESPFVPWQEVLPVILQYVKLVHIRIKSPKEGFPGPAPDLVDILSGAFHGETAQIVRTIANDEQYPGLYITEVPSDVLPLRRHNALVEKLRELVA